MAAQIQDNEFIQSLDEFDKFCISYPLMKSIHLFTERTTTSKSLEFIVKQLKTVMKTLERY